MANSSLSSYKSTIESTGTGLSKSYYLNKYYQDNKKALKASSRKDYAQCELIYEDSRALKRASNHLAKFKYSEEENEENIYNSIEAFADTYNNAIDSSKGIDDREIKKYVKKLTNQLKEYSSELEDFGISFDDKTGKISVKSDLLKNIDVEELKKVFSSEETNLLKKTTQLSKRINSMTNEYIYSQITGSGLRINITL